MGPARYLTRALAKPEFHVGYFDPFSCECRVYGRLKREGREDLAVRAHGYLLLTHEQEVEVTERITRTKFEPDDPETEMGGEGVWGRWEEHRGQPIRAIVKELVTELGPFAPEQVPQMWADLKGLHALGILVRDIHRGNYLGGKLVDFSRAWAMYNPCLDRIRHCNISRLRRQDALKLNMVIENEYLDLDIEVPQDLMDCADDGDCGIDPRCYDWRKDGEDVEEHVTWELFLDESPNTTPSESPTE